MIDKSTPESSDDDLIEWIEAPADVRRLLPRVVLNTPKVIGDYLIAPDGKRGVHVIVDDL